MFDKFLLIDIPSNDDPESPTYLWKLCLLWSDAFKVAKNHAGLTFSAAAFCDKVFTVLFTYVLLHFVRICLN